jgi:hypothetical protein
MFQPKSIRRCAILLLCSVALTVGYVYAQQPTPQTQTQTTAPNPYLMGPRVSIRDHAG